MSTLTNAQLAAKTADEIEKRGLTHGTLADMSGLIDAGVPYAERQATCPVCSVGGMAAAFYGDPNLGYEEDGNGYDSFVSAVADALLPNWHTFDYYDNPQEVVYSWNDGRGRTGDTEQPKKTTAEVVAFFRGLAAEWSAAETPAQQAAEAVA